MADPSSTGTVGSAPRVTWDLQEDGILHLLLGPPPGGGPVVLDPAVMNGIEEGLDRYAGNREVRALLVRSSHPEVFCAGADVDAIAGIASSQEADRLVRRGQELFTRISHLPCPTVALIHGTCLGGGLELALACDARTAAREPGIRIGLPEIKLGILPAWGGCTRMARTIGLQRTLELITSGRTVNVHRARRLGLVDSLVPREHMVAEGLALARSLRRDELPARKTGGARSLVMERNPLGRALLGALTRRAVQRATGGHYPAPEAAARALLQGFPMRVEEALDLERREVLDLLETPAHKNLLRIFRIGRPGRRPEVYQSAAEAPRPREAVVVGAGVMGAGITTLMVGRGLAVRLVDPEPRALARAWNQVRNELQRRVRRRDLESSRARLLEAQFTASTELRGLRRADLVLEAVPEKRGLKEQVLEEIGRQAPPEALLATNTSSFPVEELAGHVPGPERFLGLHFFNPPTRMPLLEVVRGPATSQDAVARGLAVADLLGKTPVVVGDGPGFLVNRLLTPYFMDACRLAQEGVAITEVDRALREFGMPMGPFRLMDEVGLDVILDAGRHMAGREGRSSSVHPLIEGLVDQGRLGRKLGEGFYRHTGRRLRPGPVFTRMVREYMRPGGEPGRSREAIADRLMGRMVAEARKVIGEGLVLTPEDVDLATVYGIGFPPFRGGLLHHAERTRRGHGGGAS